MTKTLHHDFDTKKFQQIFCPKLSSKLIARLSLSLVLFPWCRKKQIEYVLVLILWPTYSNILLLFQNRSTFAYTSMYLDKNQITKLELICVILIIHKHTYQLLLLHPLPHSQMWLAHHHT